MRRPECAPGHRCPFYRGVDRTSELYRPGRGQGSNGSAVRAVPEPARARAGPAPGVKTRAPYFRAGRTRVCQYRQGRGLVPWALYELYHVGANFVCVSRSVAVLSLASGCRALQAAGSARFVQERNYRSTGRSRESANGVQGRAPCAQSVNTCQKQRCSLEIVSLHTHTRRVGQRHLSRLRPSMVSRAQTFTFWRAAALTKVRLPADLDRARGERAPYGRLAGAHAGSGREGSEERSFRRLAHSSTIKCHQYS